MENRDKDRGDRFHDARKLARLTLEQVGASFGVHKSTVMAWERGAMPEKVPAGAVAELYQVRVSWLMHGEGPMRGEATTPPAANGHRQVSETRLAVAQVNEVLESVRASDTERAAVEQRLRSITGSETAEWLRGWVDGFRASERHRGSSMRSIVAVSSKRTHK